jgi:hypothetical protein
VIDLPAAADEIGFDDVAYSAESHRILVPARESGDYVVDPGDWRLLFVPDARANRCTWWTPIMGKRCHPRPRRPQFALVKPARRPDGRTVHGRGSGATGSY